MMGVVSRRSIAWVLWAISLGYGAGCAPRVVGQVAAPVPEQDSPAAAAPEEEPISEVLEAAEQALAEDAAARAVALFGRVLARSDASPEIEQRAYFGLARAHEQLGDCGAALLAYEAFLASEFYDFPCFARTVPDLKKTIASDPKAHPADKYKVLEDVLEWATNVGYPGYANAAIDEIFNTWVINVMMAKAASGSATPEEALKEANEACTRIFAKWKGRGLV